MRPEIQSFEAHVTIEPVFGTRFDLFDKVCQRYTFRPAELLLMKNRVETPERSNKDSFCTGHDTNYAKMVWRLETLVRELKEEGFQVWRYKIEGILLDVRTPPLVHIDLNTFVRGLEILQAA